MTNDLTLTQDQVRSLVQKHTDTLSETQAERSRIADLVGTTTGANKGAIFDALRKAHEFWDQNLQEIQKQFETMTQQVRNTAQRFGSTDADAGERLTKVGSLAPGDASHFG